MKVTSQGWEDQELGLDISVPRGEDEVYYIPRTKHDQTRRSYHGAWISLSPLWHSFRFLCRVRLVHLVCLESSLTTSGYVGRHGSTHSTRTTSSPINCLVLGLVGGENAEF